MNFFENLKRAAADTAQVIAKKTGDVVETSKTKYSIYDLKNEIEKIYAEIGEKVYEAYKNDINISDVLEEKCSQIDDLMLKTDVLKQKLNENK